jgi:recombination protein RecA
VLDLAVEANIVEKSGAWFSFQGERIGQGRENSRTYLEAHPAVLDKVETMVLAKHGVTRGGPKPAPAPAPAKNAAPVTDGKRPPAKAN